MRISPRDSTLTLALLLGTATALLNEYVFAIRSVSVLISSALLAALLLTAVLRRYKATTWIFFLTFFLLATRPRDLHLLNLQERGTYEYFSPNILRLIGPSVSTLALFLVLLILLLDTLTRTTPTIPSRLLRIIWFIGFVVAITTMNALLSDGSFSAQFLLTDAKFPLFVLAGSFLIYRANYTEDELFELLRLMAGALGVASTIYLTIDLSTGSLKLNYNDNTYFSIIVLGLILWRGRIAGPQDVALLVLVAIGSIPLVRGEQLLLALTILVALVLGASNRHGRAAHIKVPVVAALVVLGASYIVTTDNALTRFFFRKAAIFLTGDLAIDMSSSVRLWENDAILGVRSFGEALALLFGKGFGGTFSLEPYQLHALGLADFSAGEIASNQFATPHLFFTYWILKFGIIGSAMFLLFLLAGFRLHTVAALTFLIALPTLMWQSYWSPGYAFLMGALWCHLAARSARRSELATFQH